MDDRDRIRKLHDDVAFALLVLNEADPEEAKEFARQELIRAGRENARRMLDDLRARRDDT